MVTKGGKRSKTTTQLKEREIFRGELKSGGREKGQGGSSRTSFERVKGGNGEGEKNAQR